MEPELIELEVDGVAAGGSCVARHEDGRIVFVRHTLPGERVLARVTDVTAKFLRADAVEVLKASPDRVTAPCVFAGRCGGCDWQHVAPSAQRTLKAQVVAEQLRRLAGITREIVVEELPVEGAEPGLGWRTRVQFAVGRDGAPGLRHHRSHDIEPIDACLIAHPEVEALGVETKPWPGAKAVKVSVAAGTSDRLVAVDGRRARIPRMDAPVRLVRGDPAPGATLPFVRESAAGRLWQVSGGGFWQVHPAAADALVTALTEGLGPRRGDVLVDLYAGAGLFAGSLGEIVGSDGLVVAVESDPVAVRDARFNVRDLPHVAVEAGRVEDVLGRLPVARADIVVLDPPRAGAGKDVVTRIAALATRSIGYVSCDPATLARDLATFAGLGWNLTGLRVFDAFPMTHHVECVAFLRRS